MADPYEDELRKRDQQAAGRSAAPTVAPPDVPPMPPQGYGTALPPTGATVSPAYEPSQPRGGYGTGGGGLSDPYPFGPPIGEGPGFLPPTGGGDVIPEPLGSTNPPPIGLPPIPDYSPGTPPSIPDLPDFPTLPTPPQYTPFTPPPMPSGPSGSIGGGFGVNPISFDASGIPQVGYDPSGLPTVGVEGGPNAVGFGDRPNVDYSEGAVGQAVQDRLLGDMAEPGRYQMDAIQAALASINADADLYGQRGAERVGELAASRGLTGSSIEADQQRQLEESIAASSLQRNAALEMDIARNYANDRAGLLSAGMQYEGQGLARASAQDQAALAWANAQAQNSQFNEANRYNWANLGLSAQGMNQNAWLTGQGLNLSAQGRNQQAALDVLGLDVSAQGVNARNALAAQELGLSADIANSRNELDWAQMAENAWQNRAGLGMQEFGLQNNAALDWAGLGIQAWATQAGMGLDLAGMEQDQWFNHERLRLEGLGLSADEAYRQAGFAFLQRQTNTENDQWQQQFGFDRERWRDTLRLDRDRLYTDILFEGGVNPAGGGNNDNIVSEGLGLGGQALPNPDGSYSVNYGGGTLNLLPGAPVPQWDQMDSARQQQIAQMIFQQTGFKVNSDGTVYR